MQYEDLVEQLFKYADVIEQNENVHAQSVPRKAAWLIRALDEENEMLKAKLFKLYPSPRDYMYRVLGFFYFQYIMLKKKFKKGNKK